MVTRSGKPPGGENRCLAGRAATASHCQAYQLLTTIRRQHARGLKGGVVPTVQRGRREGWDERTLDKTPAKPAEHRPGDPDAAQHPVSYVTRKLPHVTVMFWILKIAATTLGETGGDLLAQTLKVGYLTSTLIFFAMFLVSVVFQLRAHRFHPAIFWTVIVTTSTAGTTMSDFMNRTAGLGYTLGALVLTTCLGIIFLIWWRSGQTLNVENVATFKGELL